MNEKQNPEFSNINIPASNESQPDQPSVPKQISFNITYARSVHGILRLLLVLFQFAGWVSAAAVFTSEYYVLVKTSNKYDATRGAYLFFSVVGWLIALFLFILNVLNLMSLELLNKVPWGLVTIIIDAIWIIPTFALAIVAAVRESELDDVGGVYIEVFFRKGAFGSASFFGFVNTLLYGAFTYLNYIRKFI